MSKLFIVLVILVVHACLLARAYVAPRSIIRDLKLYSSRSNASLGTMGSDVLMRPEDENSPEFKDYLRNLLKLQANRAKTGFSAPSSGTSDAYLAKLNRLKLEREALRKAGLPDSDIDVSYKPEDYEAAVFESQEPLVASAPLTGDAAIAATPGVTKKKSGNKMRELTSEEIAAAKYAEEAVARALAKGGTPVARTNNDEDDTQMSPDERLKRQLSMQSLGEDEELLENILQKPNNAITNNQNNVRSVKTGKQPNYIESLQKKMAEKGVTVQRPSSPSESSVKPIQVSTDNTAHSVESVYQSSAQVNIKPTQGSTSVVNAPQVSPVEGVKSVKLTSSEKFRALQSKTESDSSDVNTPAPSSPVKKAVKLSIEDLELSAQTLQLLIKHRGGGPFGLGRLQGEEIKDLHKKLSQIVVTLENDSIQNSVQQSQVNYPRGNVVAVPQVPDIITPTEAVIMVTETVSRPTNFASPLPKAEVKSTNYASPLPKPVAKAPISAPQDSAVDSDLAFSNQFPAKTVNVPIALGLDKFLQTPRALDIDELSALRDGLIQCLAIVQGEVSARAAAPMNNIINDPTERQFTSSSATTNDISIEKDVKTAIGLLLKHRGGPGFGHGRLQGKELEYLETKLNQVVDRLEAEI